MLTDAILVLLHDSGLESWNLASLAIYTYVVVLQNRYHLQ